MPDATPVNPEQFVKEVEPKLAGCDPQALHDFLKQRWTGRQIIELVRGDHADARKVAAVCLSLVGTASCVPAIADLLADPDPVVNHLAEHALWSIWFRAGSPDANCHVGRGAQALERRDFEQAMSHFDRALKSAPDFAEAYNQRAIAHFLRDEFEASLKDCHAAIARMPQHFGAWAGAGHCQAHLNNPKQAIHAYERALQINPHLHAIREAIAELRSSLPSGDISDSIE